MIKAKITGVGKYLPPLVVKNKDIEIMMNTSDEWIQQRTGIQERRWAEPGTTTTGMGAQAALAAIKMPAKTQMMLTLLFLQLKLRLFFPRVRGSPSRRTQT